MPLAGGSFHHVALERYNGVIKLFLNGTATGTSITDSTSYAACQNLSFNVARYSSYLNYNNYLDEFRGQHAAAYNGTNFTPPTAEYPNP